MESITTGTIINHKFLRTIKHITLTKFVQFRECFLGNLMLDPRGHSMRQAGQTYYSGVPGEKHKTQGRVLTPQDIRTHRRKG